MSAHPSMSVRRGGTEPVLAVTNVTAGPLGTADRSHGIVRNLCFYGGIARGQHERYRRASRRHNEWFADRVVGQTRRFGDRRHAAVTGRSRSSKRPLEHSPATGQALASNGQLGIDLITPKRTSFNPTPSGRPRPIVVRGDGTITYDGVVYQPVGDLYMIDSNVLTQSALEPTRHHGRRSPIARCTRPYDSRRVRRGARDLGDLRC